MQKADRREIALKRAQELKGKIRDYIEAKAKIPKGLEMQSRFEENKRKLLKILNAAEDNWNDWHWQLKNMIKDVDVLSQFIELDEEDKRIFKKLSSLYRWAVSPYYASLMDAKDPFDPIRLMGLPSAAELVYDIGEMDPMREEYTNPAGCITRRYPDRLIINVTNRCANFCRFCQRRRNIGQMDRNQPKSVIQESIEYIKQNPEIRDVLITGGDALLLEDHELEWIISQVRAIPHVEIIRIGTRSLVTLPMRITPQLCKMLKKYHPIYVNTHFNHPKEVTEDAKRAAEMLADSGIPIGNQMVLLNGVNNDKHVVMCLNHELLKIRIKPYYIFHPKQVRGTMHFQCSIDEGMEIMEYLRGNTSGLAIPTYIVNAPGGLGKTPILPTYLISRGPGYVVLRTWEGEIVKCRNLPSKDIKTIIKESKQQGQSKGVAG
ncbi:glutamate 2,3-aminomutase [Caldicoprobacter faecalis]|uniref:Glutamate 2,3-aminomutase n=1 Tax=Caldicoprobacter faecalis TaxID=937334 RepID=A0A1I5WRQ5_9FIRM|nr:glutamate 2,3-aminomutase [Caldicoprobacter faecalis]SFQ22453.1 glutamate 2,3-aminomutase [Caldicoprobacter faecalis]